jgi:hypothetical protein
MSARINPEYEGDCGEPQELEVQCASLIDSEQAKKGSTRLARSYREALEPVISIYKSSIRQYHRYVPSETGRQITNAAAPPLFAVALITGIIALKQGNGVDQPNPTIESVKPPQVGPTLAENCEEFSSGDPWFEECVKQQELRKQYMTP